MTFDVIVNSAVYEGDVFVFINMNMTHVVCFFLHKSFVPLFFGIFLLLNSETLPRFSSI